MEMKTIYLFTALTSMLFLTACSKIDNYDGPNATMNGLVIDQVTQAPFLTGQGEFSIRLLETSWSDNPAPQDIQVKQDGSYNHTKLFQATYILQPYGGAFWPADKIEGFKLGAHAEQNFEVTPYLQVKNVKWALNAENKLDISCSLAAPITNGLPQVIEVRPFFSLTPYCGAGSRIDAYYKDEYRALINQNWEEIGNMQTGEGKETYTIPDIPLKSGYTYYVRMGAKVRDTYEKFNYSEVEIIKVP